MAGIHGENFTICTACAASLQAIGEAFRKIRDGYLSVALAGGGDSRINPGGILAYKKSGALKTLNPSHPDTETYYVFDKKHNGFIPGEGGAFFVLESIDHARRRGACILAEICGYSASMDGYTMTAPHPDGIWEEKAVRAALADARMFPENIDLISAHGTGTPINDNMEAGMIARVFGKSTPPVIALKSRIGHLASACGSVELAICTGLINTGWIPGIPNLTDPCRKDIRFAKVDLSLKIKAVLLENFGFGGQNAAVVVKKWTD
jgi:3-oxoacyl-[acyl-carrier-protein] synthase II